MKKIPSRWEKLKQSLSKAYVNIDNRVLLDSRLTPSAKNVYCLLSSMCFNSDSCFPSQSLVSYLLDLSLKTVSRNIKLLKECGYISVTHQTGFCCVYRIVSRFAKKVINRINNKNTDKNASSRTRNARKSQQDTNPHDNIRTYTDNDLDNIERQLLGWT